MPTSPIRPSNAAGQATWAAGRKIEVGSPRLLPPAPAGLTWKLLRSSETLPATYEFELVREGSKPGQTKSKTVKDFCQLPDGSAGTVWRFVGQTEAGFEYQQVKANASSKASLKQLEQVFLDAVGSQSDFGGMIGPSEAKKIIAAARANGGIDSPRITSLWKAVVDNSVRLSPQARRTLVSFLIEVGIPGE